jgi:Zn-dependent protease
MALAGPGANLALVVAAGLAIRAGVAAGVFFAPESISFADVTAATAGAGSWWNSLGYFLGAVLALNLLLCVFNLFPLPPLDGSAAVVLALPSRVVPRYQRFLWTNPHLAWLGIFVAWQVFDFVFDPLFGLALSLLYPGVSYS